jgi:hypothetical protein
MENLEFNITNKESFDLDGVFAPKKRDWGPLQAKGREYLRSGQVICLMHMIP